MQPKQFDIIKSKIKKSDLTKYVIIHKNDIIASYDSLEDAFNALDGKYKEFDCFLIYGSVFE